MNTFLIKFQNGIHSCFELQVKGDELNVIVKNFEYDQKDKYPDIIYEKGFLEISIANYSDLETSLDYVQKFFDLEREDYPYIVKYPSKDLFLEKLNKDLYFNQVISKIIEKINDKKVADLDDIVWSCIKYQYDRILSDYKVVTKKYN